MSHLSAVSWVSIERLRAAGDGADESSESAERSRMVWTSAEDHIIQSAVATMGYKWRKIAQLLPNRSDDAVRVPAHHDAHHDPSDSWLLPCEDSSARIRLPLSSRWESVARVGQSSPMSSVRSR